MVVSPDVTNRLNVPDTSEVFSLDDWMLNPPDHMEWVDEQLVEKTGMTLKHGAIQSRLDSGWRSYMTSSEQRGEVYTDVP